LLLFATFRSRSLPIVWLIATRMLFFRRRDTNIGHSRLTDQERCIHACLFFAFIILIVTIVLFYFAATSKGPNDQRLFYYIGASISLLILLLIILCTIIYVRRFYGYSSSTVVHRDGITSHAAEHDSARHANRHP
jgi:uncharacterized membrane protein YedE/YeeE